MTTIQEPVIVRPGGDGKKRSHSEKRVSLQLDQDMVGNEMHKDLTKDNANPATTSAGVPRRMSEVYAASVAGRGGPLAAVWVREAIRGESSVQWILDRSTGEEHRAVLSLVRNPGVNSMCICLGTNKTALSVPVTSIVSMQTLEEYMEKLTDDEEQKELANWTPKLIEDGTCAVLQFLHNNTPQQLVIVERNSLRRDTFLQAMEGVREAEGTESTEEQIKQLNIEDSG